MYGRYGASVRERMVRSMEKTTCSICLGNVHRKQWLLRLPCGHMFHAHCIRKWLEGSDECPMCRNIQLFKVFHAVDPYRNGRYYPTIFPLKRGPTRIVVHNYRRCRSLFNRVLLELRMYIRHCWGNRICFCHGQPDMQALRESGKACIEQYLTDVEDIKDYFYIVPEDKYKQKN